MCFTTPIVDGATCMFPLPPGGDTFADGIRSAISF